MTVVVGRSRRKSDEPASTIKFRFFASWEPRLGPEATALNWRVVIWRGRLAISCCVAAIPFGIAHVLGIVWIQIAMLAAWTPYGFYCIAQIPPGVEKVKVAAAHYVGWKGKPDAIPRNQVRAFDRWLVRAQSSGLLQEPSESPGDN